MSFKNKMRNFFTVDDEEYEYVEEMPNDAEEAEPYPNGRERGQNQNVVSLKSVQASSKVVLCEPRTYNEAQEIADHVVNRRAVVLNLQRVDHQQAKRIVDFLSGTVYALNGDIQKLGSQTFLCAPDNIELTGNITDMIEEQDEYNKRW
ncbi:cell division inhibitor SepF [Terribacillus aidingensis]|uniref:Cell division protein SepF n=1 Tax=Terribacillus aidingensis TaxID=586416 RepID=A0A285NIW4_9BACI|nr:cell division protein SepF [Terribacillus aidingensis]SNZ09395.1 cell division inhibitor SepF [Terribacillus aidingensis]